MSTTPPIRRQLAAQTRILDPERGLAEYVASDQTLDSYQEVVLASGWRFSLFHKNAPFVDSHDYSSIGKLLGRVVDYRVEGDRLVETVQWAHDVPENALARLGWKMTVAGHLRAVSVGFVPRKTLSKFDADPRPWEAAVRRLGMDGRPPVRVYAEQEQIELSACLIGANPNALAIARAHAAGAIDDRDLASVGIEAGFLRDAGALLDRAAAQESPLAASLHAGFARRLSALLARPPFPPTRKSSSQSNEAFLRLWNELLES